MMDRTAGMVFFAGLVLFDGLEHWKLEEPLEGGAWKAHTIPPHRAGMVAREGVLDVHTLHALVNVPPPIERPPAEDITDEALTVWAVAFLDGEIETGDHHATNKMAELATKLRRVRDQAIEDTKDACREF